MRRRISRGRYTYTGGSTAGGAIVYDGDRFLYSHHATDPCSGLLVNAFDLVRLHKYGDLDGDAKEGTPVSKLPSFVAMSRLALEDRQVSDLMSKENLERRRRPSRARKRHQKATRTMTFRGCHSLRKDRDREIREDHQQCRDRTGERSSPQGADRDPDEFANCGMVLGRMPWDQREEKRRWKDVDDAGFYRYVEVFYGLTGRDKLDNALMIVSAQNRINDVKQYLQGLKWDGTKRLDTLLSEYLGAEDTAYTRAVMRKSLCAAVGRAVAGGIKYDYMPIFIMAPGDRQEYLFTHPGKRMVQRQLNDL